MTNKCPLCDYTSEKLISLSVHWRKTHGKTAKELRVQLFHDGVEPTCACGCGKAVKFHTIEMGFSVYCRGHQSRVHNNWGHNKVALDKSHATNKAKLRSGENVIWNKGLTKETSEAVFRYGRGAAASFTEEKREQYSETMTKNRLSGIVPSLTGSAHPHWNGGVSYLSAHCHSNARLYKEWKYPKLRAANFRCSRCGEQGILHVHHDQERMADIIRRFSEKHGYRGDESQSDLKHMIANEVADYHIQNNVSGIVLCELCHGHEHPSLNF